MVKRRPSDEDGTADMVLHCLREIDLRFVRDVERIRREEDRDLGRWVAFALFLLMEGIFAYAGQWLFVFVSCATVLCFAWVRTRTDRDLNEALAAVRKHLEESP